MRQLYILLCLLLPLQNLMAQDEAVYDKLLNQVRNLSLGQIVEQGDAYLHSHHTDTAIMFYSMVYRRFQEGMDDEEKKACANAYLKMGNIYYEQENYAEALKMYVSGLKISESCADKPELMRFYNNIGTIYCLFKDFEQGITYFEMGYSFRNAFPDPQIEMILLSNLTGNNAFIGEVAKAKDYYRKLEALELPEDTARQYRLLYNRGVIGVAEKNYAEACRSFSKAVAFTQSAERRCHAYEKLYSTYMKWDKQDSAVHYFRLCNQLAKENGLSGLYAYTLKDYAEYCKGKDDEKSHYYKSKYLSIIDSIYNTREFYRMKNVQYVYEAEKHAKKLHELQVAQKMKEERIRKQLLALLGILGGLILLSGLLFIVYRQKKKIQDSYRNLFRINRDLMTLNTQNKELSRGYEQTINHLHAQLEQYEQQQASNTDPEYEPDESEAKAEKYQNSMLNEEQKRALLGAIREVMEETDVFCEKDFSLEKLAKAVCSNHKYVSQVINEMYQKNFSDYINEYRIRKACIRLTDIKHYGNYTIRAIAESVGYKSQTTFIRAFRKIVGIPPSVYQKMAYEEQASFSNS